MKMTQDSRVISLKDKLEGCLSQQVIEYELLQSMYPNQGEIVLTDKNILNEINKFLNEKCESIPSYLDFTLNLFINKVKLEICINLPTEYPVEEPDICLRCNQLNRQQESELNSVLNEFIRRNHVKGEVCLYSVILWIQEYMEDYSSLMTRSTSIAVAVNNEKSIQNMTFQRMWIYSHHIYSKKKREIIVKTAKDISLTGFLLSGKPGIICIEGDNSSCLECWKLIKSLSWKKIMIRKSETFLITETMSARKFSNFNELCFNMSGFSKYMSELGFGPIFNDFFGLGNES